MKLVIFTRCSISQLSWSATMTTRHIHKMLYLSAVMVCDNETRHIDKMLYLSAVMVCDNETRHIHKFTRCIS